MIQRFTEEAKLHEIVIIDVCYNLDLFDFWHAAWYLQIKQGYRFVDMNYLFIATFITQ